MRNKTIRERIKSSGLRFWQVAEKCGVCEMTLTRWLRKDLSPERESIINRAIEVGLNPQIRQTFI